MALAVAWPGPANALLPSEWDPVEKVRGGQKTLLSKPFPSLPKSLSERGEINSEKYIQAEDALLGMEDEMQYLDQVDFTDDRMEDIRELLADEPDPDWALSPAWEELGNRSQPLHEQLQAIAIADFATARWEEYPCHEKPMRSYSRLALTDRSKRTTDRSRPQSARSKRPSSAGSSRTGISSRPSLTNTSRARAACPQPSCWPRDTFRAGSVSCAAQAGRWGSRNGVHAVSGRAAGPTSPPHRPTSARAANYNSRPASAGSRGTRNSVQATGCGAPGPTSLPQRPTSALLKQLQGQPPQLVSASGPVKAFAFSTSLNPRQALLHAARFPAKPSMPGRPCTPGRPGVPGLSGTRRPATASSSRSQN
eukprot:TRINITY_DN3821_c0_g1_i1.p1 TRINITY_DN3821_c0_g1~~TRINITY_DN3821_c0_g1_i1.p1  ORF type:complete len:374 (+),score=48.29 TRINITY_DN3821_c0_g1_i1:28-1122(+)